MARSLSPLARRLVLFAGALVAAAGLSASAAAPVDAGNLERLEQSAAGAADSLLSAIDARDSLCLVVAPHDAAWIVERAIVERASARGVDVRRCTAADARRVDVAIASIGVVYSLTDDDVLERRAAIGLSANAPARMTESGSAGALRTFRVLSEVVDTLAGADTAGLASAGYPYTTGTMSATSSGGFWTRIVEPAVILAASAIVAILLFTVRSQ